MDNPNLSQNPSLPEEVLIEIFSRAPAKSVGRCRCLSKSWNTNLSTSQFVKLHLSRIKTDQKDAILVRDHSLHTIMIPVDGSDKVNVSRELVLPATIRVGGSCNGLVLLLRLNDELLVVNPLTMKQVHVVDILHPYTPEIDMEYSYGFGFDNCSDDYKIVKLSHSHSFDDFYHWQTGTSVDVYSLKNGVWKSANSSPYIHYIDYQGQIGVFMNGFIHWVALDKDERYVIAAFDVATELFHEIHVPNDELEPLSYCVYATAGCLLLLNTDTPSTTGKVDMWIMKEYGPVNSWTKFSIMISAYGHEIGHFVKPMCFIRENEIVFLTEGGTLVVWNLTEGTTRKIIDDGALQDIYGGAMFVASLVSPVQSDLHS